MATWEEVQQHIARNYRFEHLSPTSLKMVFQIDEERTQAVVVSLETLMDGAEEWAEISSAVGPLDDVNLKATLREVGGLVCGGLAADGNLLVFRHVVPLENLDVNEFERPLRLVVLSADKLEREFGGGDTF